MDLYLSKKEIARVLKEVAVLLELDGANPFRVRAFQNAVRIMETLDADLGALIETKTLDTVKGIGKGLAEAIEALALKGKWDFYEELKAKFPPTIFQVLEVQGLGPKKARKLYQELGVSSLDELEAACRERKLVRLEGFGEKTQDKVLHHIQYLKLNRGRKLYADVEGTVESLMKEFQKWREVKKFSVAGSFRRRNETVKDLDFVVSSESPKKVMEKFCKMKEVTEVLNHGDTKSSVRWTGEIQVDLRVVRDEEYFFALHHFTGSKEHNTVLRGIAKELGYKLNEYGLFKGDRLIPCGSETELFKKLGMDFIPPELREGLDECALAQKGNLPELIEETDIQGFFHMHSTYSDGKNTLEEMISAANERGFKYIGVSDHSQAASYANGLREVDIDRQHKEIDVLQKKYPDIRIFKGIESDILSDGALDYPTRILKKFDFVIGSVHSGFSMTEAAMTKRCIAALQNPYCTMLGHPTGRLLTVREGFPIDMIAIVDEAARQNKMIELNGNPFRLDLDWRLLRYVRKKGVKVSINPDAHSVDGIHHVHHGVLMARKGGLTKHDVLNTQPKEKIEKLLHAH